MRSEAYIYGESRRSFPQSLLLLPKEYEEKRKFLHNFEKIPFLNYSRPSSPLLFLFLSRSKERKKIEKICLVSRKY